MKNWAENECRIACKKENPDYDFDSNEFDYGCSCYKSALKAYNSLMDDEQSGMSFSFTKNILIKLLNKTPLTPITEYDFKSEPITGNKLTNDDKKIYQCYRRSSLFKEVDKDGNIKYNDINRVTCIDITEPKVGYYSKDIELFVNEIFPIKFPYIPDGVYTVYTNTFLTDESNGDFDTLAILYIITPKNERINIDRYYKYDNDIEEEISEIEYINRLRKKIVKGC
jgi:hypothetical protein